MKNKHFKLPILVLSFLLLGCDDSETIIIESVYPEKLVGYWEHVSSKHGFQEGSENSGQTVFHDEAIFQLELHENKSFIFSRFNEDCITGPKFEYVEDEFGYKSVDFFFDCEIEWQGELVFKINADIVGYDNFDVLIFSYLNTIENCNEFCTTTFQRVP